MKLTHVRLCNFRCFGETPTTISLRKITFLLGPNGCGKTAVLQALTRMFGFERGMRRIQKGDFHVPADFDFADETCFPLKLWIEADFEFPELKDSKGKHPTIPSNFAHMRLEDKDGVPIVRFRLDATLDFDGDVEEKLTYVLETDAQNLPKKQADVSKYDRASIQVHYLPARRDPTDHISYAANSLLGRVFRAADWSKEAADITELTEKITSALGGNEAVSSINSLIATTWSALHKGSYYTQPEVSFGQSEIDGLLKHLTLTFAPGHEEGVVGFSRLGDGQKSLLYVSLVISVQELGRQLLSGKLKGWNINKLQPPVFTLLAVEEPENSLAPHNLGRIVKSLSSFAGHNDGQAVIATHSPSLLKRVAPENIRYLRLNTERETIVKKITLPTKESDAHKFVREAVQAYPELYFSRLVVLGEGDSEEILLPKIFEARGVDFDSSAISIVPLGGRHVNHFWRLLNALEIPFVTLLDLDLARHQGGWGRVRYAATQLLQFSTSPITFKNTDIAALPKWNNGDKVLTSKLGKKWLADLESYGVFFSSPLDIDFAMLQNFADNYNVEQDELEAPDDKVLSAVLGPENHSEDQYSEEQLSLFRAYQTRFKLGSKPVAHLSALAELDDSELKDETPEFISRLLDSVEKTLKELDE